MMWKKVISMLLIAAMLAMPIGCGKDGNKDKDTTSGVETTDIGDDSAETDAPPKTPVPKEDKETKESDKDTDTENETDFSDDDYEPAQVTKKEYESMSAQDLIDRIKDVKNITEDEALALYSTYAYTKKTFIAEKKILPMRLSKSSRMMAVRFHIPQQSGITCSTVKMPTFAPMHSPRSEACLAQAVRKKRWQKKYWPRKQNL